MTLEVGVKLPARFQTSGEFLADAQAYEAAGAHSLWLSDGMFRPASGQAYMPPGLDVMTLLAALAAVTSRVQLGASVVVPAQWPPALFAQIVTTLEHLGRGRLLLGLGAGWERVQLDANGVAFERRGSRLDELIAVLRLLWSGAPQPFEGEFYRLPAVRVAPAPRPGGPPLLIGAFQDVGLRRAARLGDGYISGGGRPESVRARFERVLSLRTELGRTGEFQLWAQVRAPESRSAWRETVAAYAETGAQGVIVNHAPNLLDILRNPEEDDRQDLRMAVG
jgi:alkanesulfonate monooxygenase SsuD/methylene tetrahydromethanopterin reductase-like flavin-dependent oxidoreductase (luciferase family)